MALNMVRIGVVKHLAEWTYSGYNKIVRPQMRKLVLIFYQ